SADATYHAITAAAYADLIAAQAEDPDRDRPVAVRISALAFGPLLHLGVGGELFVAHGQRIRAALGDDQTCVAALCDGSVGYLPTADAYEIGGYEPNASLHVAGEGERLAGALACIWAFIDDGFYLGHGSGRSMRIERTPGYARALLAGVDFEPGDLLIIVNAYGINSATIDSALYAKERGMRSIGVTSIA